ncbi:MAG: family 20 glycosylhydrolase [Clostridia bacterium]|nr:family 20 glycosylhydrolase [Clostridia bacterium]
MFVGRLYAEPLFFHRGTEIPFPPDEIRDGTYTWAWSSVYDTGVDVRLRLPQKSFVGAVRLSLSEGAEILSLELLADGKPAGSLDASRTPAVLGERTLLAGELTVPAGVEAEEVLLRIRTALKPLSFSDPEILGSHDDGAPLLWPAAASFTPSGASPVTLGPIVTDGSPDADFAASELAGSLAERFGIASDPDGAPVRIKLDESFAGERYRTEIAPDGVTLTAGARLPLLYAAEALLSCHREGRFFSAVIDDRPYKPMRGFHFGLPPREELDFARRVIRYVLVPLRYNQIFLEFAGGMRFDRHPEISEAWMEGNIASEEGRHPEFPHGAMNAGGRLLEKEEVRSLVGYAKSLGFEVIPEVQSFGHVQYITYAHPEIAEREEESRTVSDTRGEDARPPEFYAHCYCPSLEESYRIIYDVIDEILEVVKPERFVHMGHDEIYQIGVCPRCRGKDPAELYAKHVKRMHDYLAEKGLRMMIWSDMLQPTETHYGTSPARDLIPRDIVLLDFIWYFHFDLDMEDHLLPCGFDVLMGNLYSSHYPRYASRAAKNGVLGGEVSTWCPFTEYNLAKKGKFWDLCYAASMLWDPRYDEGQRRTYTRLISRFVQPRLRDLLRGVPRELSRAVRKEIPLPAGRREGIPGALLERYPSSLLLDGFRTGAGFLCRRLIFSHATLWNLPRVAWAPLPKVGEYRIRYADGEETGIPVEYNGNILVWNRAYAEPLTAQYYRHQGYVGTWAIDPVFEGKSADGEDVLVTGLAWDNPRPDVPVAGISFQAAPSDASIPVLCAIERVE